MKKKEKRKIAWIEGYQRMVIPTCTFMKSVRS